MIKPNPFTPRSGWEPKVFLNRDEEIKFFKGKVEEAKKNQFNHYIILGEWGIGKTTLLKYLKTVSQKENCLGVYFTAHEFKAIEPQTISLHLLQSIVQNLPIKFRKKSNLLKTITGFGIQILGTGFNLSFHSGRDVFIDPQILLKEGLISVWKDVKEYTELMIILIDDVQNYSQTPEIFTLLKNALSTDEILKNSRFLFVLSSTREGWRRFMIRAHPIGRYFIPQRTLENFSEKETRELVSRTLKDTGVVFSDFIFKEIWKNTRGHLFEIHALCSTLYNLQKQGRVDEKEWEGGYGYALKYLGENIFDNLLAEAAGEKEREILYIVSHFKEIANIEGITKLSHKFQIKVGNVNDILRRLVEKKLIKNPSRGCYHIENKLFREYIKSKLG